jgi:hypothetical protein
MTDTSMETTTMTTHGDLLQKMDVRRRRRVKAADRKRRIVEILAMMFMCLPFAWMYQHGSDTGPAGVLGNVCILWYAASVFAVPTLLVRAMLPQGETWGSRRRLPTFVPPPPLLDDGDHGPLWSPDRPDPIFEHVRLVMDAVDSRDADALQARLARFVGRAVELCGSKEIACPSSRSEYHYWPNKKTESGTSDGDTVVTYEDNHPIQHQRGRLRDVLQDLDAVLARVPEGVDVTDVDTSVRDMVAVLRRVVELEGFDACRLRPAKTPVLPSAPAAAVGQLSDYRGPGRDVIDLVGRAVRLDPDLTDALGNPIAPLLTRHVPRLLKAYRQAMATANEAQHAEIERDLLEGLELVRRATEEGLARHGDERRQALRTEIAFLRMRGQSDRLLEAQ